MQRREITEKGTNLAPVHWKIRSKTLGGGELESRIDGTEGHVKVLLKVEAKINKTANEDLTYISAS